MFKSTALALAILALLLVSIPTARAQQKEVFVLPGGPEITVPVAEHDVRQRLVSGKLENVLPIYFLEALMHDIEVDDVGFSGALQRGVLLEFKNMSLGKLLDGFCQALACVWWIKQDTLYIRDLPANGQEMAERWTQAGFHVDIGSGLASANVPENLQIRDLSRVKDIVGELCQAWKCLLDRTAQKRYRLLPFE